MRRPNNYTMRPSIEVHTRADHKPAPNATAVVAVNARRLIPSIWLNNICQIQTKVL